MTNLGDVRREYHRGELHRSDLHADPIEQFSHWYNDAESAGILDPHAMILATVDADCAPAQRAVLMKYFDADGLVFYTNLESAKAREIAGNEQVCALFLWRELERQVIVRGRAQAVSRSETLRYFMRRPRESQLGAWVSRQSDIISARAVLEEKLLEIRHRFAQGEVPLPAFWGGYRIVPQRFEFWQGRPHRLHDRFQYRRNTEDTWSITRLAP